jgi:hypothetical protein
MAGNEDRGKAGRWIAGPQLAALSMQGSRDIPSFVNAFSGSHRLIPGLPLGSVERVGDGEVSGEDS